MAGSGAGSGSVSQRYGSADPNPYQNVTGLKVVVTNENLGRESEKMANVRLWSQTMEIDVLSFLNFVAILNRTSVRFCTDRLCTNYYT